MNKVFDTVLTNRPLQLVIIAAALLGFVYWYGRRSITDTQKFDHPLPNSGSGIPAGWGSPQAEGYADRLHAALGLFSNSDSSAEKTITQTLVLTSDQLTAVYNAYNRKYCTDASSTLTTDLDGGWWNPNTDDEKSLIAKLKSLNLR